MNPARLGAIPLGVFLCVAPLLRAEDPLPDVSGEASLAAVMSTLAGDPGSAAAAAGRKAILARGDPAPLISLIRMRGVGQHEHQIRWGIATYDLLADIFPARVASKAPLDGVAGQMVGLLDLEIVGGLVELSQALSALPRAETVAALERRIAGPAGRGRARAARLLGELLPLDGEPPLAPRLVPLLQDPQPDVRLAALVALEALDRTGGPLPADAPLASVACLATDSDLLVRIEALRVIGERGLAGARDTVATVARNATTPLEVRQRAVVALGLLGRKESALLLRELLAQDPPELYRLAGWSLGAIGADRAQELILERISRPGGHQQGPLFCGLSRLGAVEELGKLLKGDGSSAATIRAGRATGALGKVGGREGVAAKIAVELLLAFMGREDADEEELRRAVRALVELDLFAPDRMPAARAGLAELLLEGPELTIELELLRALPRVGPPDDAGLREELAKRLAKRLAGPSTSQAFTGAVAEALAAVDPALARAEIAAYVEELSAGSPARGTVRVLARGLSAAGDPSLAADRGVAVAREELAAAKTPLQRIQALYFLAVDLLFAERWDEALSELRRVRWAAAMAWELHYNIAFARVRQGQTEQAVRALQRAWRAGMTQPELLVGEPDFAPLRADPRFQRLVERLRVQNETELPAPHDGWWTAPPQQPPAHGAGGG